MNPIKDQHLRPMKDIRISVIDQCNFRCSYCMPAEIFDSNYPFLQKEQYLSFSEIIKVVQAVTGLGVEKVRLTGGEPLLRKDLHLLVQALHKQTDIKDIALTTNGVYLPKYANLLKKAGLQRVNVSMDAIEDNVFKRMNGRSVGIKPVLNGIEAAQEAGLGVKINMVVQKGVNEHQIIPMASYFKERGIPLRFIEFMDVGSTNGWKLPSVVTKQEMIALLNQHFTIQSMEESYFGEVANRYKYVDNGAEVGIISSVTDSFCSTCTRARISANGKLYTCLFAVKGYDLTPLLRSSATIEDIQQAISNIWAGRKDRYSDERTEKTAFKRPKIEMSYIGG